MAKPRGRVTSYTPEMAETICNRLSEGEPLRVICRSPGMPAWRTVYHWLEEWPEFKARFTRARDLGFDAIAEEALDIANTPLEGETTETSESGVKVTRSDMLGHRKLQIETRLKLLAKWCPARYGEKIQQEHSGTLTLGQLVEAAQGKPDEPSGD